jgi:hypothetical protein
MTEKLIAASVLAVLAFAAPARAAGTYQQVLCPSSSTPLHAVGEGGVYVGCRPGAAFPEAGVYGNTQTQREDGWHGVRADAPPGARFTSLSIDLRIPFQAFNRNTWIADETGYAWQDHNAWGGGFAFNPHGNTFGVALRHSAWVEIGQSCNGSPGACEAGDWYFGVATATLFDATPPVVAPADSGLFARERSVVRGVVAVTADVIDQGKGPQAARLSVDGGAAAADAWPDSTCDFRLATPCASRLGWTRALDTAAFPDGVHAVRVSADDGLGNTGTAERAVTFDNTPPELVAGGAIEGRTVTGAAATVPVAASDATSGVARTEALVDAGAWLPVERSAAVAGVGPHRVRLRALDHAGNVSAERLVSFTLAPVPANQRLTRRGDLLVCDPGSPWSAGTRFTYVWLRDGAVIDGASGDELTPGPEDAGRSLGCRATAANEAGETVVDSPALVVAPAPLASPSPSPSPSPLASPAAARIEGERTLTIRWGQRRALAGVLLRADGSPVAGAELRASSRVLSPGALPRELGTVRTDAAGRFRLAVADGPSRAFRFRHGGLEHEVVVRVVPRVTIAARRGRVRGQVLGATARWPNTIALQTLRRGAWRTVKTVRLRAGGRFEARISAGRVRALVRAAPGWPFEAGHSRTILAP